MTDPVIGTGFRAYLRLLRYGPAARPFLAAVLGRLPISMAPLGMILLIEQERGSYSIAGFVTGAYAIGSAVGMPLWGRLMDHHGQRRILLPTGLISSTLLAALAVAATLPSPTPLLIILAIGSGLCFPPISPAIRAAWRVIFRDPQSRRVGFSLDATSVELMFVGGPLLLSALLALTNPIVPLLVAAGVQATGSAAYCLTSAAAQRPPVTAGSSGTGRHRRSALTVPGLVLVLSAMLALSIAFGQLDTSMAAAAKEVLGSADRVGILFTAIAGGSTIGGLTYGARTWSLDDRRAVPLFLGIFACFLALIAGAIALHISSLWVLLPLLFAAGLTIAPTLIMQQNLLDQITPSHRLNEAQSFLAASSTAGAACGTAVAGLLIDYGGLKVSFAGAAIGAATAALVAILSQSRWRASIMAMDEPPLLSAAASALHGPGHTLHEVALQEQEDNDDREQCNR